MALAKTKSLTTSKANTKTKRIKKPARKSPKQLLREAMTVLNRKANSLEVLGRPLTQKEQKLVRKFRKAEAYIEKAIVCIDEAK